jgi:ATP-binding cassette, subfamily F, member 3
MLQFNNLAKYFGGQTVFENVSFTINKGEKCGFVGRNGSGKTTLFRLIIGEEESDEGGVNLPKFYSIGYLDQHITFSEDTIIGEAALGLPPQEKDALYKAEAILFGLGFNDNTIYQHPSELSGGFQLRLHLTKVLLSDPDCLLLDEPTNYLDIISIRWLQKFLKSWRKELIVISHDRAFMDSITTHTLAIHRKKIRKLKGGTEETFLQILEEEEIHERTRQKLDQKKAHLDSFIKRFGAKATKAKQAQSKAKAMDKMPTLEKLALLDDLDFSFNYADFPGKLMSRVDHLSFSYEPPSSDDAHLINDLDLEVSADDCIAIVGKNGRGKSTVMKLISGELTPSEGTVKNAEKLKIGYFGQTNIDRLNPSHTVEQEIALANPTLNTGQVRSLCAVMMFSGDAAKKKVSILSGGERSRVLLAKILAMPCNLLLLDEPTHHLDMESIEALLIAIDLFPGTVIIVTHSEMILKQLPLTKLIVCQEQAQRVIIGDYDDFLNKGGWNDGGMVKGKLKGGKVMTRQEFRQRSAEIVQERAKTINPIQKEMVAIENKIESLERQLDTDNDLLIEASEAEQGDLIKEHSKNIGIHQHQIEELFKELDALSQDVESKKKHFDDLLEELKDQLS